MQVEQTNGTDTATFERTPLVKGGQGRTADSIIAESLFIAACVVLAGVVVWATGGVH